MERKIITSYLQIHWQIDFTDDLLKPLETAVSEEVIRIAEPDTILSSEDVDEILV